LKGQKFEYIEISIREIMMIVYGMALERFPKALMHGLRGFWRYTII